MDQGKIKLGGTADPPPSKAQISSERVLDAAAKLFRTRGYTATTIRDVARESQMKPSSLYYHYPSKEKLLEAVLDKSISELMDAMAPILSKPVAGMTYRARFYEAIYAYVQTTTKLGDYTAASRRLLGEVPASVREHHFALREDLGQRWNRLLEASRDAGEIRAEADLRIVRQILFSALDSTHEWFNPERGTLATLASKITSLVFDGIASQRS